MYQLHRFDTNKEKDTQQSFTSFCPDWKTVPLHKAWQKYAKKCYGGGAVPFQFYIRSESGRRWPAQFTHVDMTDNPHIHGYRAGSPTEYKIELHAQGVDYLDEIPTYGRNLLFLLDTRHPRHDLVDDVLMIDGDQTLRAEVRRYRGLVTKRRRLLLDMQEIDGELSKSKLEQDWSVRRLREADVMGRLEQVGIPALTREIEDQERGRSSLKGG